MPYCAFNWSVQLRENIKGNQVVNYLHQHGTSHVVNLFNIQISLITPIISHFISLIDFSNIFSNISKIISNIFFIW